MAEENTHITIMLSVELKREIDAIASPSKRSAFFVAAAEQELRRRKHAALRSQQIQGREAEERLSVN
jgi:predicted transcriptional regulator